MAAPGGDAAEAGELKCVNLVGFADLLPRNGRPKDGCPVSLLHRLTQESVILDAAFMETHAIGPLGAEGKFSLSVEGNELQLCYNDAALMAAAAAFRKTVKTNQKKKWFIEAAGCPTAAVPRSMWRWEHKYFALLVGENHNWKVYQIPSYAVGAQHWWSLSDTWAFEPMFDSEFPSRGQSDIMRNLESYAKSFHLDTGLVLKRTARAHGQDESDRLFDDGAFSSAGFIMLLAMQGYNKQEKRDDMRARAARFRECLKAFCDKVFGDREVAFTWREGAEKGSFDVCSKPPASRSTQMLVDRGMVDLTADADDGFLTRFRKFAKVPDNVETMPLPLFFGQLLKGRRLWYEDAAQILISAAAWVDVLIPQLLTSDALEAARSVPVAKLTRDSQLMDAVAMGELQEEGDPTVVNVPGEVRSAVKFQICKGFNIQRRWGSVAHRYWHAGRQHFHAAGLGPLVLAQDSSRTKQDTMSSLLGGFGGALKDFLTMIPPPQEDWIAVGRDVEKGLMARGWARCWLKSSVSLESELHDTARRDLLYCVKTSPAYVLLDVTSYVHGSPGPDVFVHGACGGGGCAVPPGVGPLRHAGGRLRRDAIRPLGLCRADGMAVPCPRDPLATIRAMIHSGLDAGCIALPNATGRDAADPWTARLQTEGLCAEDVRILRERSARLEAMGFESMAPYFADCGMLAEVMARPC